MSAESNKAVIAYLAEIGAKGGKRTSPAKAAASRANGKLGGGKAKSPAKTRAAQRNARKPRKGKL